MLAFICNARTGLKFMKIQLFFFFVFWKKVWAKLPKLHTQTSVFLVFFWFFEKKIKIWIPEQKLWNLVPVKIVFHLNICLKFTKISNSLTWLMFAAWKKNVLPNFLWYQFSAFEFSDFFFFQKSKKNPEKLNFHEF